MEQVTYGTRKIDFNLKHTQRKTLGIEVHPDLSVWAVAPEKSSLEEIKQKVSKRGRWIIKQQQYFEQFLPRTPIREYVSGETHYYLGRRYVLKVKENALISVKVKGSELIITLPQNDNTKVKKLLTQWYYHHANHIFNDTIQSKMELFSSYSIATPTMEIRRMKNRWGSCHINGKIILNPEIIKAPKKCIEYVVIHELCHLVIPKHNKSFYDLQQHMMPNWEKWKQKLEETLI